MFDCTGSTLTSELLKKISENASGEGGEVGTSQSSVTLDATFDSKLLDANPTSSSVKVNSMDALALVDKHLRIHCINLLNAAYYKAFVQQTFKSLQGGYPVHQFDLQHAIDHCDNEHVLEINITDFLQGVCGHLRGPSTTSADPVDREDARTPTGDTEGGDGDEKKRLTCVPFNKVDARIKKCSKLFDNHEGIKKKFSDLLQV